MSVWHDDAAAAAAAAAIRITSLFGLNLCLIKF